MTPNGWQFKVLIAGDCPLCAREASFLRRLDKGRGSLVLEDVTSPSFDPARYGRTQQQVMSEIHGVLPDGTVVQGMEVFRRAYGAVGWGWLLAPSGWPVVRRIFDWLYKVFAKYRLALTGRSGACAAGTCAAPGRGEQAG